MLTLFIIVITLILVGGQIRAIYLENSEIDNYGIIHLMAAVITLILSIASIIAINQSEVEKVSKTLISPEITIETIINDSTIVKSDTTYIYKFKTDY